MKLSELLKLIKEYEEANKDGSIAGPFTKYATSKNIINFCMSHNVYMWQIREIFSTTDETVRSAFCKDHGLVYDL